MDREYDLFERTPDGCVKWRGFARGIEKAHLRLQALATDTTNEYFAIHTPTQEIAERVNVLSHEAKHIFQIAYDEGLLVTRAAILRSRGYEVTSVVGNEAAKVVLIALPLPSYDLFIIGHAAPEHTRIEMVHWLRTNYPKTRILALNPPESERLDKLDYNAAYNAPDVWLPLIAVAAGSE